MTPNEWAAVTGGVIATVAAVYSVLKFMMRGVIHELKPNSGSSVKDQVTRIEAQVQQTNQRVDRLFELLTESR